MLVYLSTWIWFLVFFPLFHTVFFRFLIIFFNHFLLILSPPLIRTYIFISYSRFFSCRRVFTTIIPRRHRIIRLIFGMVGMENREKGKIKYENKNKGSREPPSCVYIHRPVYSSV